MERGVIKMVEYKNRKQKGEESREKSKAKR